MSAMMNALLDHGQRNAYGSHIGKRTEGAFLTLQHIDESPRVRYHPRFQQCGKLRRNK
jgi:hypothetical protein